MQAGETSRLNGEAMPSNLLYGINGKAIPSGLISGFNGDDIPMPSEPPWYVVWAMSRSERRLLETIKKGVPDNLYGRCWLPTRTERRKVKGERVDIERLLFPGYVFISTNEPQMLNLAMKGIKDFIGLLRSGGVFIALNQKEEELIRHLTDEKDNVGVSTGVIKDGKLKVIDGPLKGLERYVVKIDRHRMRAEVEMLLFGEKRRFSLGLCVVERC